MSANDSVVDQVKAQVSDWRVRIALLVGSALEGGWGPSFNVGDYGTSFGPFQMHWGGALGPTPTTAAGRAASQHNAEDPRWAVAHMAPAYAAAARQVPDALWKSNPELAAETTARIAERPAQDYYSSEGANAVAAAYQKASKAAGGGGGHWYDYANPIYDAQQVAGAVGGALGDVAGGVGGAVGGALSSAISPVVDEAKKLAFTLAFAGLGLGLIALGSWRATAAPRARVQQASGQAAQTAAEVGAVA